MFVCLLWNLLAQAELSFCVVTVVQKSYSGDWLTVTLKKAEKIFLGTGSTQNDFYYQQCNFAEREQWKLGNLKLHPYNMNTTFCLHY